MHLQSDIEPFFWKALEEFPARSYLTNPTRLDCPKDAFLMYLHVPN